VLCIRQNDVLRDVHHIGQIERHIGRVVMVLDPWHTAQALTRVWCLCELLHCAQHQELRLDLTMAPSERVHFLHALRIDRPAVEAALTRFDARTAQAIVESDHRMILELITHAFEIEKGGELGGVPALDSIERFNVIVRGTMRRALADVSWEL
jgi:hypothetical protein